MSAWELNYKAMDYKQLSLEAERLVSNWYANFSRLTFIYNEMRIKQ